MLKYLIATPAGTIGLVLLTVAVALFAGILWYVLSDGRHRRTARIARLAVDEDRHV